MYQKPSGTLCLGPIRVLDGRVVTRNPGDIEIRLARGFAVVGPDLGRLNQKYRLNPWQWIAYFSLSDSLILQAPSHRV